METERTVSYSVKHDELTEPIVHESRTQRKMNSEATNPQRERQSENDEEKAAAQIMTPSDLESLGNENDTLGFEML